MADEHPECAAWAARGECGKNPGYMLEACRETCAALSAAALSPTPHAQESHTEARNPAVWACLLASAALCTTRTRRHFMHRRVRTLSLPVHC